MLEGFASGVRREAKSYDDILEGLVFQEGLHRGGFGAQLQNRPRVSRHERQKGSDETRDALESEAVAVITGKKINVVPRMRLDRFDDFVLEVLIVHEENVMGRAVHSLKKTIAAVIEAVEHMRKIKVHMASDAIGINLMLDKLTKHEKKLDVLEMSGFIRVKRK